MKTIPCTSEEFAGKHLYISKDPYKVSNIETKAGALEIASIDTNRGITDEELLYNFYPQKESLVVNALIQCLEDELVFTQRCTFDFLTNHMPLKYDILSNNEKICLIEAGCYLLLKKNDSIIRRFYAWVLGSIRGEDGSESMISIKSDVSQKVFIKSIQNLFKVVPKDAKTARAPLQIVKTIFDDNDGLTERLLPEIASTMVKYLEAYKTGYEFSAELSSFGSTFLNTDKHLILIWQALGSELSELMGEQDYKKVLQTINLIKFFLKAYDTTNDKFSNKSKYLKPIFARILMSMNSLSNNLECMENTIPGLKLISEIILILEKETQFEKFVLMGDGIKKFVTFYIQFLTCILEGRYEKDEESWKSVEEAFMLATKNVVDIQIYIDPEHEGVDWLNQIVGYIENPGNLCEITMICMEGIISIYEKQKQGYSTYRYLQNCIQKESEIVTKLWNLIGRSPNDRKVVELVRRTDNIIPTALSSCVISKLLDDDTTIKVAAINQFTLFWKLASEYFPTFIPFTTEPLCLFHMIDFLNHDHPLVRHSSKNWLAESTRKLNQILDPIILRLLKNTLDEEYIAETQELFYTAPYDTRIVVDAFKRLRSILQTNKSDLMRFMISVKANPSLLETAMKEKAKLICNIINPNSTYLQLLIFLSIKYIRGQTAKKLKSQSTPEAQSQFISENASVNACGCEFLELLLTNIEPADKSPEVTNCVIKPLLDGLINSFRAKDSIMQVEILKIIRLILFNTRAQNKQYAINCSIILNDEKYFEILRNGLISKLSYVRSSYISYVMSTLKFFTIFLGDKLENFICEIVGFLKNNLSRCSSISTTRATEIEIIANENDVLQILTGLKSLIHHYFFDAENVLNDKEIIDLQKEVNSDRKKYKEYVDNTKKSILESIGGLLINSQKIWRLSKSKVIKDFKLTHSGILPFTDKCYSDTLDMYFNEKFTFELISKEFTSYQEAIIKIMKPVIDKYPNQAIKSILSVWIEEHNKNNDETLKKIVCLNNIIDKYVGIIASPT